MSQSMLGPCPHALHTLQVQRSLVDPKPAVSPGAVPGRGRSACSPALEQLSYLRSPS